MKARSEFSANRAGAIGGGDGLACVLLAVGACGRKRGRLMSMHAGVVCQGEGSARREQTCTGPRSDANGLNLSPLSFFPPLLLSFFSLTPPRYPCAFARVDVLAALRRCPTNPHQHTSPTLPWSAAHPRRPLPRPPRAHPFVLGGLIRRARTQLFGNDHCNYLFNVRGRRRQQLVCRRRICRQPGRPVPSQESHPQRWYWNPHRGERLYPLHADLPEFLS